MPRKPTGGDMFALISDNTQDKICSTELMFAINMDSNTFADRIADEFAITMWNYYIISDVNYLYEIFDVATDGQNDMRMKEGMGFSINANGAYTLKYNQDQLFSFVLENNIPLIRLPEMYYILAECTDDLGEATQLISTVRTMRGVDALQTFRNDTERMAAIEKEYRKEFYAEGQLWFFYKRLGYTTFLGCPIANMTEGHYRFPLPDDEIALGNIY